MKRIIQYLLIFILIIFILPAIFTKRKKTEITVQNPIEEQTSQNQEAQSSNNQEQNKIEEERKRYKNKIITYSNK